MRHRVLRRALAVCSLLAGLMVAPGPAYAQPAEWTQFRATPDLNAVIEPDSPFSANWTADVGGAFSSSPTIAHGALFVTSNSGIVASLDLVDGKVHWTRRFDEPVMTAPLVSRGVVVIGAGNADLIDWQPGRYFAIGLGRNSIYGLDEGTGEISWRVGLPGTGMPTGVIQDGTLFHHDGAGMLFALDAHNGQYLWRRDLGTAAAMSAITVVSPSLFVTAGTSPNEIVAFSPIDGSITWQCRFPDNVGGMGDGPLATDGKYVLGGYLAPASAGVAQVQEGVSAVQHVFAINASTGHVAWDQALTVGTAPPRNEAAVPVVSGATLYIGSAVHQSMQAFDVATGRRLWSTETSGTVKGASVIVNGKQYFGDSSGTIWALDAATGKPVGHLKAGSGFGVGSPITFGQTLFIGGLDGRVYARPLRLIEGSGMLGLPH